MKKYIIVFILFSLAAILFLLFPFCSTESISSVDKSKFVTIQNEKFNLNGKLFYPITINYIVGMQADKDSLWPSSSIAYNQDAKFQFVTKDSCLMQLKAEMDLITEMGLNSVRLVGIGEESMADEFIGILSVRANIGNLNDTTIELWSEENYKKYFGAIAQVLNIVNASGLKAILLVRMSADVKGTEIHLQKLVHHFRNDTTIMAYDLFNEPLYFDVPERDKKVVHKTMTRWAAIAKKNAPNQLITIGLTGIREVFEWDPAILDVDFISIHPYEYEPEQVRNEMYWYANYIKKPWIIGETAIPADNDSISYETQAQFAHKTLKQAYDCGAIGYSWWQYKDVEWHSYHANFMGVVNWKGETKTIKENIPVKGTVKPLVNEFKKFNPIAKKDSCVCLSNYYNYSQHKDCRIIGVLLDESEKPIQGGVILAWNQYWSHSYHTVTKPDGSFELLGDFPFYHWMASASSYSMIRADVLPDTAKKSMDGIPTMNIGNLKISKLSFAK
ncbi:MAG: cellulase family glycosylhydrolase [Bacteroidota bacterium]